MRKREIDREVALQLNKSPKQVGIITKVFLHTIMMQLIEMTSVRLDGLGELTIAARRGGSVEHLRQGTLRPGESTPLTVKVKRKVHVSFRKARPFNEAIRARHGRAAEIV